MARTVVIPPSDCFAPVNDPCLSGEGFPDGETERK